MNDISIPQNDDGNTQRINSSIDLPSIGQWYWVNESTDEGPNWFGCVIYLGSNFVKLKGPSTRRGSYNTRIHFDDIDAKLTFEPNHKNVLADRVQAAQDYLATLMEQLQAITASLGVTPVQGLEDLGSSSGTALATISTQVDIAKYKRDLIEAKAKSIPAMKDKLRAATETLTSWLHAEVIPLQALSDQGTDVIEAITDRIFSIELYAGLVEEAVQFAEGQPAAVEEKLRVFQRMLFCDEEALLAYDDGGMDITHLGSFQEWLSRPVNRDRILPYPRCLVAMRVRRESKDREWDGSLQKLFRNMRLSESDKQTFLFIRNGENLYRISTGIEFDELIFPEGSFDLSEPMMVKLFCNDVKEMITRREYDDRVSEFENKNRIRQKWMIDNPEDEWVAANPDGYYHSAAPRGSSFGFSPSEWVPFDNTSVYFDEAMAKVSADIKNYNRVAVIIQGLFDRSDCLAPHKPVRSWTPEGFMEAIELSYDGMGLTFGEPPCFETYRQKCNALIDEHSILGGQEAAWLEHAAEIECRRIDNDWRSTYETYRPTKFRPYGDEGPGVLAIPSKVIRTGKAVFAWHRERRTRDGYNRPPLRTTLTVPFNKLLNVSAYKKGDYKMFFSDPRTREQYLQWAPLLMMAEDYYLKGTPVQHPVG